MIDQKKHLDSEALNRAMELLHFGYRAFTAQADQLLEQQGLGRVHHRIMYFVAREPGIAVGALRETLAVSKQALHGPLRDLQQNQLVIASPHPNDRRSRCLSLSQQGNTLEQQVTQAQHTLLTEVLGADVAEIAGWRAVMVRLARRETDRPLD